MKICGMTSLFKKDNAMVTSLFKRNSRTYYRRYLNDIFKSVVNFWNFQNNQYNNYKLTKDFAEIKILRKYKKKNSIFIYNTGRNVTGESMCDYDYVVFQN